MHMYRQTNKQIETCMHMQIDRQIEAYIGYVQIGILIDSINLHNMLKYSQTDKLIHAHVHIILGCAVCTCTLL